MSLNLNAEHIQNALTIKPSQEHILKFIQKLSLEQIIEQIDLTKIAMENYNGLWHEENSELYLNIINMLIKQRRYLEFQLAGELDELVTL